MPNAQCSGEGQSPNLPANMVQARISFPTLEREVVMPVVRPTVPKAEVTSNSSGRKPRVFCEGEDKRYRCDQDQGGEDDTKGLY